MMGPLNFISMLFVFMAANIVNFDLLLSDDSDSEQVGIPSSPDIFPSSGSLWISYRNVQHTCKVTLYIMPWTIIATIR